MCEKPSNQIQIDCFHRHRDLLSQASAQIIACRVPCRAEPARKQKIRAGMQAGCLAARLPGILWSRNPARLTSTQYYYLSCCVSSSIPFFSPLFLLPFCVSLTRLLSCSLNLSVAPGNALGEVIETSCRGLGDLFPPWANMQVPSLTPRWHRGSQQPGLLGSATTSESRHNSKV